MERPYYITLLSDIQDHDSCYTEAAFVEVLKLLPKTDGIRCHEQWSDVGKHFRSYQHFGYFLTVLPQVVKADTSLNFLEVEHGKGLIDGHFGRMRQWTMVIASKVTISTIAQYRRLLQGRADHAMKQGEADDAMPCYVFKVRGRNITATI